MIADRLRVVGKIGFQPFVTVGARISNVTTRKYDKDFEQDWTKDHGAQLEACVIDSAGNVIMGGLRSSNVSLRKYNAAGTSQWTRDFVGDVYSLGLDPDDYIAVGGDRSGPEWPYYTTRRYSPAGAVQWSFDSADTVWGIAADDDGDIYIGTHNHFFHNQQFQKRAKSNGSEVWIEDLGTAQMHAVHFGRDGFVYCSQGSTLRKYNKAGTLQWSRSTGGTSWGIAVDEDGNYYVATSRSGNVCLRKYNSAGTLQWSRDHGSTLYCVALDKFNNVYTGGIRNNNITTRIYTTDGGLEETLDHGGTVFGIAVDTR